MGMNSVLPLPVQDSGCCSGKLGDPSWELAKGLPKTGLSPAQREPLSLWRGIPPTLPLFPLLEAPEPSPMERTLFLCGAGWPSRG